MGQNKFDIYVVSPSHEIGCRAPLDLSTSHAFYPELRSCTSSKEGTSIGKFTFNCEFSFFFFVSNYDIRPVCAELRVGEWI